MKANALLKLLRSVKRPLVAQVSYGQTSFQNSISSTCLDHEIWDPDSKGGDAWCIQSFCLYHSNCLADFRNSFYILYGSDLFISKDTPLLTGIKFRSLHRDIAFAEGTSFDWGLYFAKYFGCSLIIHMKNPQRIFSSMIRPEDTLDQVLQNWHFKSVSLNKLSPHILYLRD